jgi:2-polyprenyl-3-methyl-5-hydroxy-6-metoxy-1,4-benzoquinol methylase
MSYNNKQYWNNLVGNQMSLREVGWPSWTEAFNKARYRLTAEQTIATLQQTLTTAPTHILEIGCGIGFWTNIVTQLYPNAMYVGIDISANAVANLQQKYSTNKNISIVCADIGQANISELNQSFDLVICMEVLLHITDDAAWQNAIKNILHYTHQYAIISDPFIIWQTTVQSKLDNNKMRTWATYKTEIEKNNGKVLQIKPRTFLLDNNADFKTKFGLQCWQMFFKAWHKLLKIENETLGKILGSFAYRFDKWYSGSVKFGHGCREILIRKEK